MKKKVKKTTPVAFDSTLADFLDLIAMGTNAGIQIEQGMALASQIMSGPLGREFQLLSGAVKVGQNFDEACVDFANRHQVPAVHQMMALILMSSTLGALVAEPLQKVATAIREKKVSLQRDRRLAPLSLPKTNGAGTDTSTSERPTSPHEEGPLRLDQNFLDTNPSIRFLELALGFGANVLLVGADSSAHQLLAQYLKHDLVHLESSSISSFLLQQSASKKGKSIIATLDAPDARLGVLRLQALLAIQEKGLSGSGMKSVMNLAIPALPIVVALGVSRSGQVYLNTVSWFLYISNEEGTLVLQDIFQARVTGMGKNSVLIGYVSGTGFIPPMVEMMESAGVQISRGLFLS